MDRSFIARLCDDARYTHLVEAMIRMAHASNLSVVAEGVETAEQLSTLAGLGCDRVQGYLFGQAPDVSAVRLDAAGGRFPGGSARRTHLTPGTVGSLSTTRRAWVAACR